MGAYLHHLLICVVHVPKKRSYKDHNGILRTPAKEQPSHYHINIRCIQVSAPKFVPSSLCVPPEVLAKFTRSSYLRLVFNIILL